MAWNDPPGNNNDPWGNKGDQGPPDLDEAIKLHNDVSQGLSSSIFTDRLQNAEKFLSHVGSDCGIANVNIGAIFLSLKA